MKGNNKIDEDASMSNIWAPLLAFLLGASRACDFPLQGTWLWHDLQFPLDGELGLNTLFGVLALSPCLLPLSVPNLEVEFTAVEAA